MGIFERYLSIWVAMAIALGIILGIVAPALFANIATWELYHVNVVIAVLIWLMVFPMMVQIDITAVKHIARRPQGLALTIVINWLIKPFSMAALSWLFFTVFFTDWVSPDTANEYIAGMILLGVAPCTAMVFVWSQLTNGDATYTLTQVAVNDVIMIFAFAPIAGLLLGMSDITVPWDTLLLSVGLYVIIPLIAGMMTRRSLTQNRSEHTLGTFLQRIKPFSIFGLLATVALLFGFQAQTIMAKPLDIVLIAIPLLIQTYGIFAIAYWIAQKIKLPHNIASPACLIGTSNFFELAVAVAISLFGLHSGAALATVVGVLVEVPVMLSLVAFANKTKHWFSHSSGA